MDDSQPTSAHCLCHAEHDRPVHRPRSSWLGTTGRFFGWWFGMSGLMGMFAVCPCCGQQGCANGIVGMGFVGAVLASFMRVRNWFRGEAVGGDATVQTDPSPACGVEPQPAAKPSSGGEAATL